MRVISITPHVENEIILGCKGSPLLCLIYLVVYKNLCYTWFGSISLEAFSQESRHISKLQI